MRFNDWQTRLAGFIAEAQKKAFAWGDHDCAMFACDSVRIITGEDPAADFRGKYDTRAGAYEALKEFAGGGLAETAEKIGKQMGKDEIPSLMAQRGDLVLCNLGKNDTLGIVAFNGRHVWIAADNGLATHPLSVIKRAWRID